MDPFEVMAEPVRRRIIEILASGEHTAGEIAAAITAEFRITRTAVSKHLRILRDAQFVEVRADERWRWYFFTATGLERLEDAVDELRDRMSGGVGEDPFGGGLRDPLRMPSDVVPRDPLRMPSDVVPRRGPGRPSRRGTRGHQRDGYVASEPDLGLFPTVILPLVLDEVRTVGGSSQEPG